MALGALSLLPDSVGDRSVGHRVGGEHRDDKRRTGATRNSLRTAQLSLDAIPRPAGVSQRRQS
jgi:hypothetical protein